MSSLSIDGNHPISWFTVCLLYWFQWVLCNSPVVMSYYKVFSRLTLIICHYQINSKTTCATSRDQRCSALDINYAEWNGYTIVVVVEINVWLLTSLITSWYSFSLCTCHDCGSVCVHLFGTQDDAWSSWDKDRNIYHMKVYLIYSSCIAAF